MPATGQSTLLVVLPEGCTDSDPDNCLDSRGVAFEKNESSTWSDKGLYEMPLYEESRLGYRGNANFGFDNVTLGWPGEGLPSLPNHLIAGFATKDVYLGQIGLNPRPLNFTSFEDPHTSLLQALRDAAQIPSLSWAYTAGAYNNVPRVAGSLTLGGYDASRFVPNDLTFRFGPDISQDFLVAIQSITTNTSTMPLLPDGIFAPINSLVSQIWLPVGACQAFEQAFGLEWDNVTELYPVSDDLHAILVQQNPSVTFRLGQTLTSESTEITMPYSSFDLTASPPLVRRISRRYFPLRRAANDSQYNLGRAFLQNAYLIADYERSTFSVSQAVMMDNLTPPNLTSIRPPTVVTTPQPDRDAEDSSRGMPAGRIAGTVCGSLAAAAVVAGAAWYWFRRRRHAKAKSDPHGDTALTVANPELDGAAVGSRTELEGKENPNYEAPAATWRPELQAKRNSDEDGTWRSELPVKRESEENRTMPSESRGRPDSEVMPEPTYELPADHGHRRISNIPELP